MGRRNDYERLVKAELPVLYRVARRLGADPDEAEDLVQQTVVKAWRKWHQFDGRYLRSWLVRILRNERLAKLRTYRPETDTIDLLTDEPATEDFWSEVENDIEVERIFAVVAVLPEPYRLAVQLCDVEQMSYEEAAEAMDVPIGTVRSRLFRARVEIRKRLEATS
ncbi:MAG: sigma-70 family RNA polymerase sigma factor [Armatimonadetes bacterium]|nr:sigma-70 family RNA polymerase sigma factor [Armatimonadota bacterium]